MSYQERQDALIRQLQGAAALEPVRLVGSAGQPAFTNGWVNFGVGRPARFYRHMGRVYLAGLVSGGTLGLAAFTLPVGYLPDLTAATNALFVVDSNGAYGRVLVSQGGAVIPNNGDTTVFSLDGVSFRVA